MLISTVNIMVTTVATVEIGIRGENMPKKEPMYMADELTAAGRPSDAGSTSFMTPITKNARLNMAVVIMLMGY